MPSRDAVNVLAPPVPLVALAGWLVPGSGYWLIGQRTRGLVVGVSVIALFLLGLLIAGVAVVEAPNLGGGGGGGNLLARVLQKPWFLGQVMAGPLGLVSAWVGESVARDYPAAKARLGEIGTLYTAVAGMLNLIAIIDSSHRASNKP